MSQPYQLQDFQVSVLNIHPHFEGKSPDERLAIANHFLNVDKTDPFIHHEGGSTLNPLAWAMLDVLYPAEELLSLAEQNVNI